MCSYLDWVVSEEQFYSILSPVSSIIVSTLSWKLHTSECQSDIAMSKLQNSYSQRTNCALKGWCSRLPPQEGSPLWPSRCSFPIDFCINGEFLVDHLVLRASLSTSSKSICLTYLSSIQPLISEYQGYQKWIMCLLRRFGTLIIFFLYWILTIVRKTFIWLKIPRA